MDINRFFDHEEKLKDGAEYSSSCSSNSEYNKLPSDVKTPGITVDEEINSSTSEDAEELV